MTTRFRRQMFVLGMTILIMQAVFMPVGMVYSETTMDTEEHEPVERSSVKNLLEELTSEPNFFFQQSHMQGIVNSPINVTISSNQKVSEVKVRLPEEATLLKDQLPTGILVVQGAEPYEWIVQSESVQTTFVLPLLFEFTGKYEISVKDIAAIVEISNKEDISGEALLKKNSSTESATTTENEFYESSSNNDKEEDLKDNNPEEPHNNEESPRTRSSVNVSTWDQYAAAINDQTVTTINVTANISGNTTLNTINRNLTINGNGFTINSQGQRYSLTGANRQITVINATITGTLTGSNAQFQSGSGASNTRFTFSDIIFLGTNRFVGPSTQVHNIFQTVLFDGGKSSFPDVGSAATLFLNVSDLSLINQTSIDVRGRGFKSSLANTSVERLNALTLTIEEGSSLSMTDLSGFGLLGTSVNVNGTLNMNSLVGPPVSQNAGRSQPIQFNIGATARVMIERTSDPGALFNFINSVGGEIVIAKGSEFDFVNKTGRAIISNGPNPVFLNIESDRLALWDIGLHEEKASMVFSDIALQAAGVHGSEIISTNNERFQRLYDPAGLTRYSRISNLEVEEMDRFVTVHYESEDGVTLKVPETLSGLLGDPYQSLPKDIPGYQLTDLPENASGEFTRETIQVTYVYQQASVAPLDPLDPEIEVNPENKPELPEDQGQLSIDFASTFNFGSQAISVHDQIYYAQPQRLLNEDGTVNESEERPNYVQISDRRSEKERNGWTLAVTQKEQFKGEKNQVLNGARLSLSNQQVIATQGGAAPGLQSVPGTLVPGNRRTLLHAQGSEGTGTWIYRFGDGETSGESVALYVPRGANPEATTYSTTLIWELSAVPNN